MTTAVNNGTEGVIPPSEEQMMADPYRDMTKQRVVEILDEEMEGAIVQVAALAGWLAQCDDEECGEEICEVRRDAQAWLTAHGYIAPKFKEV